MQTSPITQGAESRPDAFLTFVQTILRSGLCDRDQLQAYIQSLPPGHAGKPEAFAKHLIQLGKLTPFQAKKLLDGAFLGLVLGPYQVLSPIGKGGMGTVYLARDSRNQQLLALKILPPKRAREEDRLLARFQREMEMCRRVAHPHLTQTYDVGVYLNVHYIAMEYIPGQTLYRLVTDQGPLTAPRAARLFAEVALGLDHAHGQGLIHRDLKPSNIMVTPHDHAKVLDLGLALVQNEMSDDKTITGGQGYVVGTMDYIAPEQVEDASKVDPRSDIYGLGCALYFALTGQPPFPGGNSMQKIMRHLHDEPVAVTDLNPTVPAAFGGVVRKMMAKRPERRYPTAAAAREELLAWAPREPVQALDRPDDPEYQRAVTALKIAEVSAEQVWETIVAQPRSTDRMPALRNLPTSLPMEPDLPFWLDYLVPVGLGSIILMELWVIGLKLLLNG